MGFKQLNSYSKGGFVLLNVLLAILATILLVVLFYGAVKLYTDHGVEVEVPNITGMLVDEAESMVESVGMELVIVDSIYTNKVPRGIVIKQTPPSLSRAKRHRPIYVVINAKSNRRIQLPDVINISSRQATSTLEAMGLRVTNIVYQPHEYRDLVLKVTLNGRTLKAGESVEEGSPIVLVVSSGKTGGTRKVVVPDLRGKTLEEAKALLEANDLVLGSFNYDEQPTEENMGKFVVYTQNPGKGSETFDGDEVGVLLTRNLSQKMQSMYETSGGGTTIVNETIMTTPAAEQDSIDDDWF